METRVVVVVTLLFAANRVGLKKGGLYDPGFVVMNP